MLGADSWTVLVERPLQAAPAARLCPASFEVLCTFPCLANAKNDQRQPLLPFGTSMRSGGSDPNTHTPPPTPRTKARSGLLYPLREILLAVVPKHVIQVNGICAGHQPQAELWPCWGQGSSANPKFQ